MAVEESNTPLQPLPPQVLPLSSNPFYSLFVIFLSLSFFFGGAGG